MIANFLLFILFIAVAVYLTIKLWNGTSKEKQP